MVVFKLSPKNSCCHFIHFGLVLIWHKCLLLPVKGGTIGSNGIRVWSHGGGSSNPTNGKMEDKVEMIAYRGARVAAANQFLIVQAS